jgi:hypothetical protein
MTESIWRLSRPRLRGVKTTFIGHATGITLIHHRPGPPKTAHCRLAFWVGLRREGRRGVREWVGAERMGQ